MFLDCILLLFESLWSFVDSIVFVDEGFGSFGVYIKKMFFDSIIFKVMDEGIFFDEWDLLVKISVFED